MTDLPPAPPAEHDDPGLPDNPDEPDEPELLVARGVFGTASDKQRFEDDVLPSARAFLAYWAQAGLEIAHGQARLFVSPPPKTPALRALPKLYGDGIFAALDALVEDVAKAPTNEAALDVLDAFTCAHPPLHRNFLEDIQDELDNPVVTPSAIATALEMENAELTASDATFSFRTDNGEFVLPSSRKCSYILLGHATDRTRSHPFLEKDVVNHELGHGLHYGLWLSAGRLGEALSSTINESVADILAHVFDGDACHGKVLDKAGKPVGCRRNMDGYEMSVSDEVWQWGTGDHDTGQALRDLVWKLRAQTDAEELATAIIDGVAAVPTALNRIDEEPLATAPSFSDDILADRFSFMREYDASSAFYRALCTGLGREDGVCGEYEARIGDPRHAMRETWLAHAPTVIGSAGITLADGRQVSFEVEVPYIHAMTVTERDGAATRYESSGSSSRTDGVTTLWFGESSELGWTAEGKLVKASNDPCTPYDTPEMCAELEGICEGRYDNSCGCSCADDAPGCTECPAECFTFACVRQAADPA